MTSLEPFRYLSGASGKTPGTCSTGQTTHDGNDQLYAVGAGQCLGVSGSLKVTQTGQYQGGKLLESRDKAHYYISEKGSFNTTLNFQQYRVSLSLR